MALKGVRHITFEAVRVRPGPTGEPEIGISSVTTGSMGLHLGGYPLPHHPVAADAVRLQVLMREGRWRRRGCAEEEDRVCVVVEVVASGAHERRGLPAAVAVGGGSVIGVGAEQSTGGGHESGMLLRLRRDSGRWMELLIKIEKALPFWRVLKFLQTREVNTLLN